MTKTVTYFTDRITEKDKLRKFFQKNDPTTKKVLEINGMHGIGKSQMLKWAYNQYQPSDIICAFYDFKSSTPEKTQFLDMLRCIAITNQEQCSGYDYSNFLTLSENAQKDNYINENDIQEIVTIFNTSLSTHLGNRPMFVFYDTTEEAHPKTINILNDQILSHHIDKSNIKFAFSGEKPLYWSSVDIRKRRRSLFLDTFDSDEMLELIEKVLDKEIFIQLPPSCIEFCLYISAGNPGILKTSLDFLANYFSDSPVKWDRDTCQALINHVFQIFIKEKIISRLHFDDELDKHKLVKHIAMLRKIDLFPFKSIIANHFQTPFSEKSARYYDYLLNQIFSQSHLFKKIEYSSGYRINTCFRRMNLMQTFFNDSDEFHLIKQRIQDYYHNRISIVSGSDLVSAICEYLFFKYALIPSSLPISLPTPRDATSELQLLIHQTRPDESAFIQDSYEISIEQTIEADEDLKPYFEACK
jgi:hypothetical protein